MRRTTFLIALCFSLTLSAQTGRQELAQGQLDILLQAQQTIAAAEQAGAAQFATTLLEEARWRFARAQENWNKSERGPREESRMRANEALAAARAAIAKSRWLSTNAAIRDLEADVTRLGGRLGTISLAEERADLAFNRGNDSRARVAYAQSFVDQAEAAGAAAVPNNDLRAAQQNIDTAKKLTQNDRNNASADHLAFMAEMIARRAMYLSRLGGVDRHVAPLQLERTRLAQAENERQEAAARAQRQAAEREAAALQQRLAEEAANRQAQSAELENLRRQIEENRRVIEQRIVEDRNARTETERRLDALMTQYESAIATGAPGELEALRQQVEDQQITLRSVIERERLGEEMLSADIASLRAQLDRERANLNAEVLAQRESDIRRREEELTRVRNERTEAENRRAEAERQQRAEIEAAQQRRREMEEQAEKMRQQVAEAQAAAHAAQQSAQQTQTQLQEMSERLTASETEARRLRMQQELSTLATTRTDERGLIVTLPGIFFDVGKSQLKPGARNTLTRIAERLKANTGVRISVEGHTDSTGSDAANQKLSEARANAVRDFLVAQGFDAARISATGQGEGQPIATNNTTAGRQQNRRVELVITE